MGKTFTNLTIEDLCDLMCGGPEDDGDQSSEPIYCDADGMVLQHMGGDEDARYNKQHKEML